ncbi:MULTISPECIES: hypothetical protein [Rhodococcus]|uniref:Uncharacterized protein n=1 Tax=Rhodococcus rhodochrous TaxID=1829 RepID=A0AAW4XFU5_RHORH|nr:MULTISPECIES: hypothetical protein [Rhodococcus]MCD2111482.1 hypothetical protein [Rhodococcus rhodochrous]MDC3724188.1 hypothetical protein [Rhodococcus sp. Rp3]QHG81799.1 hypothetical protein D1O33_07490 [Rhodococcus rhodochrous]QOH58525.1 hypothetical protein C6Y44_23040 [Rhodococcus rhodochrous]WSE22369.1 hypothetical protein U9J23_22395 [Rhodococcus sp. PD04]
MDSGGAGSAVGRSKWGKVRVGSRWIGAVPPAIALGILATAVLGAVVAALGLVPDYPVAAGVAVALATAPSLSALAWVLLVDRSTLEGAADRPEDSVEASWYEKAASGAFTDILLVTGLGCTALAFAPIEVEGLHALMAVILVAFASFGVRYAVQRRKG